MFDLCIVHYQDFKYLTVLLDPCRNSVRIFIILRKKLIQPIFSESSSAITVPWI